MSLIHIHVPTYVDVPISLDRVTTQNKCYLNFYVHLSFWNCYIITHTWLILACKYLLIYMLVIHSHFVINIATLTISIVCMSKVYTITQHTCMFLLFKAQHCYHDYVYLV